ncbi:MAG: hypothetical protein NC102_07045 [Clostridium sp.]|nr:hypothetical protein [Clostridium sp.]
MKTIIIAAFLATAMAAQAAIVNYPAPNGAELNDAFTVKARQAGEEWQNVAVYKVKVDEVVNAKHNARPVSMAYFDCDGEAQVMVISNKQKVNAAKVRPNSYGIVPKVEADTLYFSAKPLQHMSVEVNGDIFSNLHLFVNPIDANALTAKELKKLKKDKNFIYFAPGVHKLDSALRIGSGQTVYVAGGAVVDGCIEAVGAENARIIGRGMVYPDNAIGVYVKNSKNVEVSGLFTTQCAVGGSDGVDISNVKVMSWYGWGDGFNIFASDNVRYKNIFARTSDDCHTIYCTRKGFEGSARHISMEDAILWADVAHPIMIGLHGSFNPATPDSVVDARYKNIDILDHSEKQIDYQGCLGISCGDNNLVKDITFEDIRVDNFRKGQLVNMRIFFNKKYCQAPGRGIEDITFRNVSYNGDNATLSIIGGYNEQRKVRGVKFINLSINGQIIHDDMPEKPKWYRTSDFANMYIGEHVEDVTFTKE